MRIVHFKNVAGLAGRLAQAQKALGHEAFVYARADSHRFDMGFPYDALMDSGPQWNLWLLRNMRRLAQ